MNTQITATTIIVTFSRPRLPPLLRWLAPFVAVEDEHFLAIVTSPGGLTAALVLGGGCDEDAAIRFRRRRTARND
jgi:hypothetical protein